MSGETIDSEGTWAVEGDTLTVTIEGSPIALTLEDGALVGMDGSAKMIFGREEGEATDAPAEVNAADYVGMWYLNSMEEDSQVFNPADLGAEMSFDFREDGTVHAIFHTAGNIDEGEGTWTIEGDTLTVTLENTESPSP